MIHSLTHAQAGESGRSLSPRKRRLLFFVNPVSGKRRAVPTFLEVVKPMLLQADIDFKLISE